MQIANSFSTFMNFMTINSMLKNKKKYSQDKYNKITHKKGYKILKEHVKCKECGCLVLRINEDGLCEDCGE